MQPLSKLRVQRLRDEIAELSDASRQFKSNHKYATGTAEHENRILRLNEIMDELRALADCKES